MRGTSVALIATTLALLSLPAQARDEHSRVVQGRVLDVTPVVRIVQVPASREVCREEVIEYRGSGAAPTLVGAIIGGTVGNQFGGGSGRKALTVAGAALGGAIGNDYAKQRRANPQVRTTCQVVDEYREEERVVGYHVEYEYRGEVFTTRTRRDPGQFIDLQVSMSPLGN
ncbi:MAG: glycine zipper 2TM domain-containing protein [Pseudomonadota bacterium]